ncbi:MAG: acetoacetate--CoA ligase [Alphaproteobacteria bacterium]|nr:acetoacetate--CoA ligase [Alphaproteobacteria bacterium]
MTSSSKKDFNSMASAPDQTQTEPEILFQPSAADIANARLTAFKNFVEERTGLNFGQPGPAAYAKLHQWSVEEAAQFWDVLWDFTELLGEKGDQIIGEIDGVPWARFYPNGRISYAENMLRQVEKTPHDPAIIARVQDGEDRVLSWQELYDQVSIWQQALEGAGLEKGDCLGVYLTNVPETVVLLLATSNIGARLVSAGMEMGPDDLINRFGQLQPKILVSTSTYTYGQKEILRLEVIKRAQKDMPSIQKTVMLDGAQNVDLKNTLGAAEFLDAYSPQKITFNRHDFNHPLYTVFSSGTTGKPKCIVHSSGGVLLKHMSEYVLHSDVRVGDRVFYHATPSWMMWNWLASGLAAGASILMYDGSPAYPDSYAQWRFTSENGCTHYGTAAPLILDNIDEGIEPAKHCDFSNLRVVMSTGAILPENGFEYIQSAVKKDVKICSISGGTDIVGCHLGGNPFVPTYAGQLNGAMLGMDIRVFDDEGQEVANGKPGELVCINAFPSMPVCFANDPDGEIYLDAYFNYFPGQRAWRHGDFIQKTPQGQYVILGRSDSMLNQNGVRIGASVIYEQLEAFKDQVTDGVAVDFISPQDKQAKTVLFLALKNGAQTVPDDLAKNIKTAIKNNVTPYAIPAEIMAAPDILRTPNGKKAEVVVKKIINGKKITNASLYGEDLVRFYEGMHENLVEKYAAKHSELNNGSEPN